MKFTASLALVALFSLNECTDRSGETSTPPTTQANDSHDGNDGASECLICEASELPPNMTTPEDAARAREMCDAPASAQCAACSTFMEKRDRRCKCVELGINDCDSANPQVLDGQSPS
ncbi:MAG: hypothetical protein AAF799_10055 [Myxococcota bacterium]